MGLDLSAEERAVRCVVCKVAETGSGETTVTLERDSTTLVIKGVPAQVCSNCGEAYVNHDVASRLLIEIEEATRQGIAVEVRRYAA